MSKPYLKSVAIAASKAEQKRFPLNIPAFRNFGNMEFHKDVTFFVGKNGSGKSTLLEAIAQIMGMGGQGGTGNFSSTKSIQTRYRASLDDDSGQSGLDHYLKPVRGAYRPKDRFFLRAESLYNIGTYLEDLADDPDANTSREVVFKRYGGKSLHHCSHGESFMTLLVETFGGSGLYLLDEPEAALSPSRQLAALVRINDLVQQNSQFIIATHSPILMAYPNSIIYLFDESGYKKVEFEETEHYRITHDFLKNHPKRLEQLMSDS
jgi:predicted ATPase